MPIAIASRFETRGDRVESYRVSLFENDIDATLFNRPALFV